MDVLAHKAAIRFVQSLDRIVDVETFNEDDAWAVMQDLLNDYVRGGRQFNAAQVAALREFGHLIGIRPGGPANTYLPALEDALGPCTTLTDEELRELLTWAHGQVNAHFEQKQPDKVQLDAEPRGPVPPPRKPLW